MHVFCDERGDFRGGVSDNIKQSDDVGAPGEVLENLDLSLDFLLLDRLENLDDAGLVVLDIDPFEDLVTTH